MIELFPEGFEEVDAPQGTELAAYTDAAGEERMWAFFGGARARRRRRRLGGQAGARSIARSASGRLWVGPPWETPPGDALAVVVDPGRAFGTGVAPDDAALPAGAAGARARAAARRRLRLRRARDRRRAARLRAGRRRRHRGAVDRGDARERARERRRRRARGSSSAGERLPGAAARRREHLARVGRGAPGAHRRARRSSRRATSRASSRGSRATTHVSRTTLDGWASDVYRRE